MSPFRDPRLILLLGPTPPCETEAGQLAVAVLLDSSQSGPTFSQAAFS